MGSSEKLARQCRVMVKVWMSQGLLYHAFGVHEGYQHRSTKYVEGRVDVPLSDVRRIGVDENYLGKKARHVTLVVDLESGRVLWVGKGRGKEALESFWERLRRSGTKIEAVACDMSGAYWSAINEHLPDAALVFDHFHIIKLVKEKIDEIRRGLQRTLELSGQKFIKGTRYLLLYGRENLPPDKRPKLEEALACNESLSKACYLILLW